MAGPAQPVPGSVLDVVGGTPMVALRQVFAELPLRFFAKLEYLNPGGSGKDRAALNMIRRGVEAGDIVPGRTLVVESTSGNMGIGLAQACAYYGIALLCVVDVKTTEQNLALLRTWGATVDVVTEPDPSTGEFLEARLRRVRELTDAIPGAFWPNQYESPHNRDAHRQTMREIFAVLGADIDYLFVATSTCGTITGCAMEARALGLRVKVCGVDAVGSVVLGGERGRRLIPGHGATSRPGLCDMSLVDIVAKVDDRDCVVGCRRLLRAESILAGGSSGAVIAAARRLAPRLPEGASCVLILPDRGERYLATVYDPGWLAANFPGLDVDQWEPGPPGPPATVATAGAVR